MTCDAFTDLPLNYWVCNTHLEFSLIEPLRDKWEVSLSDITSMWYLPAWLSWDRTEKLEPGNIMDGLQLQPNISTEFQIAPGSVSQTD